MPVPAALRNFAVTAGHRPLWRRIPGRTGAVLWRATKAFVAHDGLELSGHMAFTAILALFPFLIFLTALAGFVGDATMAERFVSFMLEFGPGPVTDVLAPVVRDVLTQQRGDILTVGIVLALWTASSGVEALRLLLNRSYGVVEDRPIWKLRLQSVMLVLVGAIFALLISVIIVLGPVIWHLLERFSAVSPFKEDLWFLARYGFASVMLIVGLSALHRLLPRRRKPMAQLWPGVILTCVVWLLVAAAFSIYVTKLATYSVTYGSLGGVIATLIFFYVTAIIFAFGAEVNGALFPGPRDPAADRSVPRR
ncbi:MAG: YihY/virulence factor BrkB family protein [Ferrovibrionaceae bacterium]